MQAKVWAHMNNLRAEDYRYIGTMNEAAQCPQICVAIGLPGYLTSYRARELLNASGGQFLIVHLTQRGN